MSNVLRTDGEDVQPVEERRETPQDLRMLRQLGDYAVSQCILKNPLFRKLSTGKLTHAERTLVREQLRCTQEPLRKLAETGAGEAIKGKDPETALCLQRVSQFMLSGGEGAVMPAVHPATAEFIRSLDGIGEKQDFIRIGAAFYALLRTVPVERLLARLYEDPQLVRARTRSDLGAAGSIASEPSDVLLTGSANAVGQYLERDLEDALRLYVTGHHTFHEGIMKGINLMAEAKIRWYQELDRDLEARRKGPAKDDLLPMGK